MPELDPQVAPPEFSCEWCGGKDYGNGRLVHRANCQALREEELEELE